MIAAWIVLGLLAGLIAGRFIWQPSDAPAGPTVVHLPPPPEKPAPAPAPTPLPEPEIIYGDAEEVLVYQAKSKPLLEYLRLASEYSHIRNDPSRKVERPEWHERLFLSCEQAFAECGECQLDSIKVVKIGGKYFKHFDLTPLKLTKPKIAKGKK